MSWSRITVGSDNKNERGNYGQSQTKLGVEIKITAYQKIRNKERRDENRVERGRK